MKLNFIAHNSHKIDSINCMSRWNYQLAYRRITGQILSLTSSNSNFDTGYWQENTTIDKPQTREIGLPE